LILIGAARGDDVAMDPSKVYSCVGEKIPVISAFDQLPEKASLFLVSSFQETRLFPPEYAYMLKFSN
jgi:hypothetical protein